ncbi:heat shock protein 70 family [Phlyctochytrium arcticum]|nr:heat shock protein 70 family [Phlyctochytrium arcticum]
MAAAIGPHPTLAMDLGTTHLLTAHYNQATSTNHSIPVQIDDTQSIDCSMTFLKGEVLIGLEAARLWKIVWPRRTVENWGYLVGMKYTDPRVARLQRHVPYHLGCDVDGTVIIELEESEGGPHMRIKPAELITIILKFAKENAEAYLSRTFPSVVLTIPSSISLSTRATILRAAHSAGFAHIRALTDATAAAVACMFHLHARKQTIHRRNVMIGAKDVSELLNENPVEKALLDKTDIVLSMNVGATHVDCAVLAVASGVYSVLATKGLTDTGASEVDYIIMEYFEELIPKAYPDSKPTRRDMHILFMNCENLKKALTYSHDTSLTVDFSFGPMELTLTREKMDFLAAAFYARCMVPLQQAVADANVDPMDITTVVLSGGGVKIPKLRDDVSFLFPNRLFRFVKLDPAKAVGFGASLEAALLEGVTAPPIKN